MSAGDSDCTRPAPELGAMYLVCRCGGQSCALPIQHVVETMRPLPLTEFADTPETVLGVAMVRGEPVPVVDGGRLLGSPGSPAGRFVSLRLGQRRVALAVESVVGVMPLPRLGPLPPLLKDAASEALESLGSLDGELLSVLQATRLLPPEPGA